MFRTGNAASLSGEERLIGTALCRERQSFEEGEKEATHAIASTKGQGQRSVMICADRRFPDVVKGFCNRGAGFLICPSGGMFGPKSNDDILQTRSRENGKYIVFVHPAEFLVTAPHGSIVQSTVLGDRLVNIARRNWHGHRLERRFPL